MRCKKKTWVQKNDVKCFPFIFTFNTMSKYFFLSFIKDMTAKIVEWRICKAFFVKLNSPLCIQLLINGFTDVNCGLTASLKIWNKTRILNSKKHIKLKFSFDSRTNDSTWLYLRNDTKISSISNIKSMFWIMK